MPYQSSWYIENRIIHTHFYGHLTVDEFVQCGDELTQFTAVGIAPIFLLIDSRDVTQLPLNFQQALQALGKFRSNPQLAWTLVVSNNTLLKYLNLMASKVIATPTRTFNTVEEAEAFIVHNAPDLAPLLSERNPR